MRVSFFFMSFFWQKGTRMRFTQAQIEERTYSITDFVTFKYMFGTHIFDNHYNVSREFLRERYKNGKFHFIPDEIQAISRFDNSLLSEEDVVCMIKKCILNNTEVLQKHLIDNPCKRRQLYVDFDFAIGDGIIIGADWNKIFRFSRLCVIVVASKNPNYPFDIITAFPTPGLDEIDDCWDAIDVRAKWIKRQKS